MVSIVEQGFWLGLMIIALIGAINAGIYYKSSHLSPILILTWINILLTGYSLCYYLGRTLENPRLILIGFTFLICTLLLNTSFFKKIFGNRRNYQLIHAVQIAFAAAALMALILNPPILTDAKMIFPISEQLPMMIALCLFMMVGYDYSFFSIGRIKQLHLQAKFYIFPLVLLIFGTITIILYTLSILQIIPFFVVLIPALCSFTIYSFVIRLLPETIFIAPVEPINFEIVSRHGIPLYALSTKQKSNEPFIRGAVTAIHHIFKTYVDDSSTLQSIQFNNLICYVEWRQEFFIVYIDKFPSPYVKDKLARFANEIEEEVTNRLKTWDGDMLKFMDIGDKFRQNFSFLKIFLENHLYPLEKTKLTPFNYSETLDMEN